MSNFCDNRKILAPGSFVSRCEAFSVCSVILVLSSAEIHNRSRRWKLCVRRPRRSGSIGSRPHCCPPAIAVLNKRPVLWSRPWFPGDRFRGILRRLGIADPAPFDNLDRPSQRCCSLHIASAVPKRVALSSPPKCGCDVTSAAESMQVAKFTKYAGFILVISVV